MNHHCQDCHLPISNGKAHKRSISFKLVVVCRLCAIDRGWDVTAAAAPAAQLAS